MAKPPFVKTDYYSNQHRDFIHFPDQWMGEFPNIEMKAFGWIELVDSLKTASLLITGRHHAVYAACKARLPFAAIDGNSHKIRGLVRTSGVNIPVARTLDELRDVVSWAEANRTVYDQLFDWMERQDPNTALPTF